MGANDDTYDEFREHLHTTGLKPKAKQQNAAVVADLLAWMKKNRKSKRFETLRPDDLQTYIDKSEKYRRSTRSHLRRFYRWLREEDRVSEDPTIDITAMPVPVKQDVETLSDDQIAKLYAVMSSSDTIRVRATASLALYAGANVSEIQGMTTKDIANTRPLRIRLVNPAGDVRIAALHDTAARALKTWVKRRNEAAAEVEKRRGEDLSGDALWISERFGKPLKVRQLEVDIATAGKQAGIDPCTYGILRQTYAARLIEDGATVEAVQEALGLSSVNAVASTYGPLFDSRKADRMPPDEEWRRLTGE